MDKKELKLLNNMSEQEQLEAVSRNGLSIQYIDNPSEKVQLEAVRRDAYSIKYIDNPSEEVQLEAVRGNGLAIKHIKNPSKYVKSIINIIETAYRYIYVLHEPNKEPLFTIGCQRHITKETFIQRIYEEDGGLECNPHRQEYLDILNRY